MIDYRDFFPLSTDMCITLAEAIKRIQDRFDGDFFGKVTFDPSDLGLTHEDLLFVMLYMEEHQIPVTPYGAVFMSIRPTPMNSDSETLERYQHNRLLGDLDHICLNSKIRSRWG